MKIEIHDTKIELRDTRIELKDEIKDLKIEIRSDQKKLQEIYEARNNVTVNFTRAWMFASICIAFLSGTIVVMIDKSF